VHSKGMVSGKDAATALLKRLGYATKPTRLESQHAQAWERVAGDLSRFSRPGELKCGTFLVIVAASALVQEFRFREDALLLAIRAELPDAKIKKLRFQTGRFAQ